jgi:TPR repeat protein
VGFTYWLDGNNVEAAKWYRRAAEQGNLLAQADLAGMYKEGKGVPQDYVEAAKWCRRAAQNDTVEKTPIPTKAMSQHELGTFYEKGLGLPQDYAEAAKW